MKLISWNVNGIRAVYKKGFVEWFEQIPCDVLCLQETKAHPDQLPDDLLKIGGYTSYFASAERKGYSGVAVYTNCEPKSVEEGFGEPEFNSEGRTLRVDFGDFILFNIYFPNGKASPERLQYKMNFYEAFLKKVTELHQQGKKIVICGDVNTAHQAIDLARPKQNESVSGFLPVERAWIDKFLSRDFIDTFRELNKDPEHYTWWDYKTRARERNIGWRIDYFYISESLKPALKSATIMKEVMGSDHCPIGIDLAVDG